MTAPTEQTIAARAEALYARDVDQVHRRTDTLLARLILVEWVAGAVCAMWVTPRTWIGSSSSVHIHVWAALVLGGLISMVPGVLAALAPGRTLTRHVIAAAQMLWSALLIDLTGGRPETHFHVFGSLAFLAFYRDWRVLVTASTLVAADHFLRGVFWPLSVFGSGEGGDWRWLEHAGWVIFEDTFLVASCVRGLREMRQIAERQARLEESKSIIEREVDERTAELREAKAAALQASEAKSTFLANMSHEIRTPMTAMLGFADLLLDPAQTPSDRADCIGTIRRNGEHLLTIINDILDLSKIEAGRMTVESIECSPVQIVHEVLSLMQVRAAGKDLELRAECDPAIPAQVLSDPVRLRQILVNLVGNAIKFTQAGRILVTARFDPGAAGGPGRLRFEVSDTGIGMTPEQIDRLFSAFCQGDTSTTRKYGGSGLGLTISRRLAALMGGDVTVVSKPGAGSCFTVLIAATPATDALAQGSKTVFANPAAPSPASAALAGLRILLAEDGPDNQRLITFHLRKAGATVDIAENGRIAAVMAYPRPGAVAPYSVILMDMQMPELDGYGAASLLRQRGCPTPIIALTAHAMAEDRQRCIAAGCDDYQTKPINRDVLIKVCREWADRAKARAA